MHFRDQLVLAMCSEAFLADHIEIAGQETHRMSCWIPVFGNFVSSALSKLIDLIEVLAPHTYIP
jgi:hypothetical protein